MKILQVIDGLRSGGAEGFVTNLAVSLNELDAEVRFFLTAGVRGERGHVLLQRLRDAGIEVTGIEERRAASWANFRTLSGILRDWKPDIVQANLYSAEVLSAAAALFSLRRGTVYVRRLVDTNILTYRSPRVLRWLDRVYPTTIACSPAVGDAYRGFMTGRNRSRIVTISNGGKLLERVPDGEEKRRARTTLQIPENAFIVAHIGRMSGIGEDSQRGLETAQKAHDVLIYAFARAFSGDQSAVLLCAGDGPLRRQRLRCRP